MVDAPYRHQDMPTMGMNQEGLLCWISKVV